MRFVRNPSLLAVVSTLALAACSQADREASGTSSQEAAAAAPAGDIAAVDAAEADVPDLVGAAPGVAFTYNYAFTLPANAVGAVQEQHAAACGKLGVDRCRVTRLTFEQSADENPTARLDLLIAPELAHSFGSAATSLVERADGELSQALVNGTDAGAEIDQSNRRSASLRAEIARIETRLKVAGLARETRVELERRLQSLQEDLRSEGSGRAAAEQSLATTPMHFAYAAPGALGSDNPFAPAMSASWSSAQTAVSLVLLIAGYALPWLLLLGAGWWAAAFVRRRRAAVEASAAQV